MVSARSLQNLNRNGTKSIYTEVKKRRNVSVTETSWNGIRQMARQLNLSVSEFIEQIGRNKIVLSTKQASNKPCVSGGICPLSNSSNSTCCDDGCLLEQAISNQEKTNAKNLL